MYLKIRLDCRAVFAFRCMGIMHLTVCWFMDGKYCILPWNYGLF